MRFDLYTERICRIESEISQALQAASIARPPDLAADSNSVLAASDSVLVHSPRVSRP